MSRRRIILAVLVLTAVTSTWILNRLSGTGTRRTPEVPPAPDYYMEDFTTLTMDENGKPKNRLYAVYMAHYAEDDTTELLRPRLEYYRPDRSPLQITANKGWVTGNAEVILLDGNVELLEKDGSGQDLLRVNTEEVRVLPEQGYAETDAYATIQSRRTTVSGTGMRVDLSAGRLKVLNNVHTIIEQR